MSHTGVTPSQILGATPLHQGADSTGRTTNRSNSLPYPGVYIYTIKLNNFDFVFWVQPVEFTTNPPRISRILTSDVLPIYRYIVTAIEFNFSGDDGK